MYVVVMGDPFKGLEIYGLFEEYEDALEWAEKVGKDCQDSWWIVKIQNKF